MVLGHGAGMAHCMWLRENATVIEVCKCYGTNFLSMVSNNPVYSLLTSLGGVRG